VIQKVRHRQDDVTLDVDNLSDNLYFPGEALEVWSLS
jgi:hypothetical protein